MGLLLNGLCRRFKRVCLPRSVLLLVGGILFLLLPSSIHAAAGNGCFQPVEINLARHVQLLKEESGPLTLADVASPGYASRFVPCKQDFITADFHKCAYWFRFKLEDLPPSAGGPSGQHCPWLLEISHPTLGWIDYYYPAPEGTESGFSGYRAVHTGVSGPDRNRDVYSRTYVLKIPAGTDPAQPIFLRLNSSFPHKFRLTLWSLLGFQAKTTGEFWFFGMVYGIMLCMILYNFFLFIVLRDQAYLLYILYILSIFLFELFVLGHIKLLMALPPGWQIHLHWFFMAAFCFFAALFTRSFLNTPLHTPVIDKWLKGYMALAVVAAISGFTKNHFVTNVLGNLIATISFFLFLAVCWAAYRKNVRQVRFYFIGWGVLMFGLTWWNLLVAGVFDPRDIHAYIFSVSTGMEAVLMSFALGDRVRILQKEREKLQKSAARYKRLSDIDSLTLLYNKGFLMRSLPVEISAAREKKIPLSVIIMDVDNFKAFNDAYGHLEGDKVLYRLGAVIRECIRTGDLACRYGGEEFVVILPETGMHNAIHAAERIREKFGNCVFKPHRRAEVRVSLSLGAAEMEKEDDPLSLINRADEALYHSKGMGKNRTTAG